MCVRDITSDTIRLDKLKETKREWIKEHDQFYNFKIFTD